MTGMSDLVYDVMKYISKHYSENLTAEQCSKQSNMSYSYFSRNFKKISGMTFKDYQIKCRIDLIVQELKHNPHTDMQDLFFRVGYRDYSTAWRNFRKVMGMSPTEFVNTLQ